MFRGLRLKMLKTILSSYRWSESSDTTDTSEDELMDFEELMDSDNGMLSTEILPFSLENVEGSCHIFNVFTTNYEYR